MIMAAKIIQAGNKIKYVADAKVIHSHNYSGKEQFKRNFDLAVSQVEYAEIFQSVPSENEGIRMVKKSARELIKMHRYFLIPQLVWQSGWKYL